MHPPPTTDKDSAYYQNVVIAVPKIEDFPLHHCLQSPPLEFCRVWRACLYDAM